MAFLKFILIVAFIYYALKFVMRLLMPYALKKLTEKMYNQMYKGSAEAPQTPQEEGKITIQKQASPSKGQTKTIDGGDYIDYEEIK